MGEGALIKFLARMTVFSGSSVLVLLLSGCGQTPADAPARSPIVLGGVARVTLLSPVAMSLAIGQETRFVAVATDASGNTVPVTDFVWSVSNPDIASVTTVGVVNAVSPGSATLTASFAGIQSNAAQITVTLPPNSIRITPLSADVNLNTSQTQQQFVAVAEDIAGNSIPGVVFSWTSSDTTLATVDQTGLATGLACGRPKITASANGLAGPSATLTVLC